MRGNPVTKPSRFRIVLGLRNKVRIDIQRVDMAVSPNPPSNFDYRMARSAAKIANNMS